MVCHSYVCIPLAIVRKDIKSLFAFLCSPAVTVLWYIYFLVYPLILNLSWFHLFYLWFPTIWYNWQNNLTSRSNQPNHTIEKMDESPRRAKWSLRWDCFVKTYIATQPENRNQLAAFNCKVHVKRDIATARVFQSRERDSYYKKWPFVKALGSKETIFSASSMVVLPTCDWHNWEPETLDLN